MGYGVGREIDKLTAVEVKNLSQPGRYGDGGGLYLEVEKDGSKRWLFRYQLHGRRRDMGLGAYDPKRNSLAQARKAAQDAREQIGRGTDPIDARRRPTGVPTFAEQSRRLIADLAPGWRGAKTEAGWTRSLLAHAAKIGAKPVDAITTEDVLQVVRPLWSAKPESGGKLRERIERVLDSARAGGVIEGPWENPARWKGHLAHMLPKRKTLTRGHFAALPYAELPAFMGRLHTQESMGARALEFTVYTWAREGMVIGADWKEVRGDLWTVPGSRMKDGKSFVMVLSPEALAVLDRVSGAGRTGYIFKGSKRGSHISNATMDAVLDRMDLKVTVHGFRSTARDWAGDCTEHAREVIETALAHKVGDAVERAYRRSDAIEKRRALMNDYAAFAASAIRR